MVLEFLAWTIARKDRRFGDDAPRTFRLRPTGGEVPPAPGPDDRGWTLEVGDWDAAVYYDFEADVYVVQAPAWLPTQRKYRCVQDAAERALGAVYARRHHERLDSENRARRDEESAVCEVQLFPTPES